MAPSPRSSTLKMPSVSKLVFYQPACLAAPVDAEVLADLEATSRDIAYTISEGPQVPDGWGIIHLASRGCTGEFPTRRTKKSFWFYIRNQNCACQPCQSEFFPTPSITNFLKPYHL